LALYANIDDPFFRIGPQEDLVVFGIHVDTSETYGIVVTLSFIHSGMRTLSSNYVQSWLINTLQNKASEEEYEDRHAYELCMVHSAFVWFDFFIYIHLLLAQIDFFFFEMTADLLMQICIAYYYVGLKQNKILYKKGADETTPLFNRGPTQVYYHGGEEQRLYNI
jgi:hypothetical protein